MMLSFILLILGQYFFIVLTTAASQNENNILCSNIKPVENVNLQQLEGKWLGFEMYNGSVNGAKALAEICVLVDLEKHDPGVKFESKFFNNGSRLYSKDMVFGDDEQTNPFLLLSVDAEQYMTQVVCSHPPDPSKATIAYLITYRRVGVSLSEETIEKLRDDVRRTIDLQELGLIMSYGTSCESQNS
ncbi:hypothetical protein B566_EDAN006133 [Ephemera danica]|nr:hypothetical protein B566_EDAN006133 [Ephemera danica]